MRAPCHMGVFFSDSGLVAIHHVEVLEGLAALGLDYDFGTQDDAVIAVLMT